MVSWRLRIQCSWTFTNVCIPSGPTPRLSPCLRTGGMARTVHHSMRLQKWIDDSTSHILYLFMIITKPCVCISLWVLNILTGRPFMHLNWFNGCLNVNMLSTRTWPVTSVSATIHKFIQGAWGASPSYYGFFPNCQAHTTDFAIVWSLE